MLLTTVNSRVVKCFLDVVHVILMPFMEPGCWILCHHVSLIYVFLISSKISFLNCINDKTQTREYYSQCQQHGSKSVTFGIPKSTEN